jgi:hypothetical protein
MTVSTKQDVRHVKSISIYTGKTSFGIATNETKCYLTVQTILKNTDNLYQVAIVAIITKPEKQSFLTRVFG